MKDKVTLIDREFLWEYRIGLHTSKSKKYTVLRYCVYENRQLVKQKVMRAWGPASQPFSRGAFTDGTVSDFDKAIEHKNNPRKANGHYKFADSVIEQWVPGKLPESMAFGMRHGQAALVEHNLPDVGGACPALYKMILEDSHPRDTDRHVMEAEKAKRNQVVGVDLESLKKKPKVYGESWGAFG